MLFIHQAHRGHDHGTFLLIMSSNLRQREENYQNFNTHREDEPLMSFYQSLHHHSHGHCPHPL